MQTGDKFKVDYQLARVILMSAQIPLSGGLGGINGEIYIWEHFICRFRSSEIELKTFYTDFIVCPEAVCDWWRHLERIYDSGSQALSWRCVSRDCVILLIVNFTL